MTKAHPGDQNLGGLSQRGLIRVPTSPNVRRKAPAGKLDEINERLGKQDRTLHPTKGFRHVSAKRARAENITASIWAGHMRADLRRIRHAMKG